MESLQRRMIVASNRLPIRLEEVDGEWKVLPGSGGLVTALAPVMARCRGLWVGWFGSPPNQNIKTLFQNFSDEQQYDLSLVPLTDEEETRFYRGFSNESLWPLFHGMLGHCKFDRENFEVYHRANRRFAEVITQQLHSDDLIWIHDYQLMLTGLHLRLMGVQHPIAFFLHTPFPPVDMFRALPWREEILNGLMEFDVIGLQTSGDFRNFLAVVRHLLPEVVFVRRSRQSVQILRYGNHTVRVGHFPISIDFDEFNDAAQSDAVEKAAWYLHENVAQRQLILGIDRLDYTKGIPERFLAFERALEKHPDLIENVSLLQIVIPSRTRIPDYADLKGQLEALSGRINGRFSRSGWIPIHYMFRTLDRVQLLAHYRACEIALVTPIRDGMNLIAKEYCAGCIDNNGVLILSEFAGAFDELGRWALGVNPYDVDGTAAAIYQAFTMAPQERLRRMKGLRQQVRRNDVHKWMERYMVTLNDVDGVA